jgi:hypothetical protein
MESVWTCGESPGLKIDVVKRNIMGEVVFVMSILLLLMGAMGFYFYSRMMYTEKKINLLETILLDIKMMMEAEEPPHQVPPPKENMILSPPEMVENSDVEELKVDDESSTYYSGVIDSIANKEEETLPPVVDSVDYEPLSRDELVALAEKRSLRITKKMNRQTILTLLRESDKNTSVSSEQVVDGGAQLDAPTEDISAVAI